MDPPVSDDLELLFERDARWTKDVGAVKAQLQKECGLLRGELPG